MLDLANSTFKGYHTNLYFEKVTGILYETKALLKYVFLQIKLSVYSQIRTSASKVCVFANKIVCIQSDSNKGPLYKN
jgi:hypothetical protein